MKFGVVVFPGSNCDRDMMDSLKNDLQQEVVQLWHKDKDLSQFTTDDCIVLPGGFSYGDYLRCGAIARFSPMMQSVIAFPIKAVKYWVFVMASRYYAKAVYCPVYYYAIASSSLFVKIFL